MKKKKKWFVCIISLVVFIILSILVLTKKDIFIDSFVYNFLSNYITSDLTKSVVMLTNLGSAFTVIGIVVVVLIIFKNKKYGLFMSLNLIIITILQLILKSIFTRSRPIDISLIEETGYSFPSGHSLTVMAFYGLIVYFIYKSSLNKNSKILFITLFSLVILVVGLSRVYLGVHFFTDVLGAYCFSIFYLIIYTSVIDRWLK